MFDRFKDAFPAEPEFQFPIDERRLAEAFLERFGVSVPVDVQAFWRSQGSGYFGDRTLYVFGEGGTGEPRDGLIEWNAKDFWRLIYPPAAEGGPVFFAETCFGDQLGFRWVEGTALYTLFIPDTCDAFVVAKDGQQLFDETLSDRGALMEPHLYPAVPSVLGPLPAGMHFAPLISPMLGFSPTPKDFAVETPNVHLWTAIETFRNGKPPRFDTLSEGTDN